MTGIEKLFISFYSTMFLILLVVGFITNTKQYVPVEVGLMLLLFLISINSWIHESMAKKYIKGCIGVQSIVGGSQRRFIMEGAMIKKMIKPEEETITITNKVKVMVDKTKFICSDGAEFYTEKEAEDWEGEIAFKLEVSKIPFVKIERLDIGDCNPWTRHDNAYYLKTPEELELICKHQNKTDGGNRPDWKPVFWQGEDWYIFSWEDGGDSFDTHLIKTLSEQKMIIDGYLNSFKL